MRPRPCIGIVLVLSAGLAAQTAAADPQEDVAAAGQKWGTVFAENNPDTMMPFYAKDGVLWGTLSPTVRSDPAAVKAYFVAAFQALPKATVKFGDQLIRVYGNTAVNTGYYTFSYTKDGETKSIPARFSFHLCQGRQRLEDRGPPLVGDVCACAGSCPGACSSAGTCPSTSTVNGRA